MPLPQIQNQKKNKRAFKCLDFHSSVSDLGFIKLASLKFRKRCRNAEPGLKIKRRETESGSKRQMIKGWNKTYEDMCDRAHQLDLGMKKKLRNDFSL